MNKLKSLFYIFLPLIVGGISALITGEITTTHLYKPPLNPPEFIFPIVWTILYLLLGSSYYLYKKESDNNSLIDKVYYTNLALNGLWTILFFKLELRFLAIIDIVLLLVTIIILLKEFYKSFKLSTYLNIPYALWVTFATYLTIAFYLLNK